jgi:ubiquinone/menaquinone biosynthesis C-methylase UbiE
LKTLSSLKRRPVMLSSAQILQQIPRPDRKRVQSRQSAFATPSSFASSSPGWSDADGRPLPAVPEYLKKEYHWAYGNPLSVKLLDRTFLVNIVLAGNFEILKSEVLDELTTAGDEGTAAATPATPIVHGRTLQVACVYGDFTQQLSKHLAPDASLDVVDVLPVQLENLQLKLHDKVGSNKIALSCHNATALGFQDDTFDQVVLFFLLHEMPNEARIKALAEASRVVKPGGKMIFLDFYRPKTLWHRLWIYCIEPFANDLWTHSIRDWLPNDVRLSPETRIRQELFYAGCYQKVVVTVPKSSR